MIYIHIVNRDGLASIKHSAADSPEMPKTSKRTTHGLIAARDSRSSCLALAVGNPSKLEPSFAWFWCMFLPTGEGDLRYQHFFHEDADSWVTWMLHRWRCWFGMWSVGHGHPGAIPSAAIPLQQDEVTRCTWKEDIAALWWRGFDCALQFCRCFVESVRSRSRPAWHELFSTCTFLNYAAETTSQKPVRFAGLVKSLEGFSRTKRADSLMKEYERPRDSTAPHRTTGRKSQVLMLWRPPSIIATIQVTGFYWYLGAIS